MALDAPFGDTGTTTSAASMGLSWRGTATAVPKSCAKDCINCGDDGEPGLRAVASRGEPRPCNPLADMSRLTPLQLDCREGSDGDALRAA